MVGQTEATKVQYNSDVPVPAHAVPLLIDLFFHHFHHFQPNGEPSLVHYEYLEPNFQQTEAENLNKLEQ